MPELVRSTPIPKDEWSKDASACSVCERSFTFCFRAWGVHHCRNCGSSVCDFCSRSQLTFLQSSNNSKPQRRGHPEDIGNTKSLRICRRCLGLDNKKHWEHCVSFMIMIERRRGTNSITSVSSTRTGTSIHVRSPNPSMMTQKSVPRPTRRHSKRTRNSQQSNQLSPKRPPAIIMPEAKFSPPKVFVESPRTSAIALPPSLDDTHALGPLLGNTAPAFKSGADAVTPPAHIERSLTVHNGSKNNFSCIKVQEPCYRDSKNGRLPSFDNDRVRENDPRNYLRNTSMLSDMNQTRICCPKKWQSHSFDQVLDLSASVGLIPEKMYTGSGSFADEGAEYDYDFNVCRAEESIRSTEYDHGYRRGTVKQFNMQHFSQDESNIVLGAIAFPVIDWVDFEFLCGMLQHALTFIPLTHYEEWRRRP